MKAEEGGEGEMTEKAPVEKKVKFVGLSLTKNLEEDKKEKPKKASKCVKITVTRKKMKSWITEVKGLDDFGI